jgi:hypothetical protein
MIETLSNDAWTSIDAPVPANAYRGTSALDSVSCVSANSCTAVGQYSDSADTWAALIDIETNGSWSAIEAPLPANATSTGQNANIDAVSCATDGTCAAIGSYLAPDAAVGGDIVQWPMIETLVDGTWQVTQPPVPSDAVAGEDAGSVGDVSCASASTCIAVGGYASTSNAGLSVGLIETLSGAHWSPSEVPLPPSAGSGTPEFLSKVSCTQDGVCASLGGLDLPPPSFQPSALIDTLSAGVWGVSEPPLSGATFGTGFAASDFGVVSCASDDTCVAIGEYQDMSSGAYPRFADTYSAGTWTTTSPMPSPSDNGSATPTGDPSISCAPGPTCTAIGDYTVQGSNSVNLIDSLAGGEWTTRAAPLPSNAESGLGIFGLGGLRALSCPSKVLCFAVGGYWSNNPDGELPLIETGFNVPIAWHLTRAR